MPFLRSLLFNFLIIFYSLFISSITLPLLLFPNNIAYIPVKLWSHGIMFLLKITCGITYEVRGKIPKGKYIVASKHQSAWETIALGGILKRPIFILKKELIYTLPIVSLHFLRLGFIPVDRKGKSSALRKMVKDTVNKYNKGTHVIIFPEGTRTRVGDSKKYQPGIAAIYKNDVNVLPVALNSGLFWPKHSFIKKPGKIIVEFLPLIPAGLKTESFMQKLHHDIETASAKLVSESTAKS